jgi:hypothetical protein
MYASGEYSLRALAAALNADGIPTPSVARGRKRSSASWTVTTVRNILTNERYLGCHV